MNVGIDILEIMMKMMFMYIVGDVMPRMIKDIEDK